MPNVSNALNQIRHLGFVIYVFGPPTVFASKFGELWSRYG